MKDSLYFECHITLDPVFDEKLMKLQELCKNFKFKVAKLLYRKRQDEDCVISTDDSFCTGHASSLEDITQRMLALIVTLKENGYKIIRYKIENIIIDSRMKDVYNKL